MMVINCVSLLAGVILVPIEKKKTEAQYTKNGKSIAVILRVTVNKCFLQFISQFPERFPNVKGGGGEGSSI